MGGNHCCSGWLEIRIIFAPWWGGGGAGREAGVGLGVGLGMGVGVGVGQDALESHAP